MATNSGGWLYESNGTPVDKATADNAQARVLEIKQSADTASTDATKALQTANAYAGQIAQANTTAGSAVAIANDAKDTVETIEGPISTRLGALEVIGGLEPGDVSDATVQNLITQDGTGTRAALNAQVADRTVPSAEVRTVFVSTQGDDANDGLTLAKAKATVAAALADLPGAGLVQLPYGSVPAGGDLVISGGQAIRGAGPGLTTITHTGSGSAITPAAPGTRTYRHSIEDVMIMGPGKAMGGVGIDLASVSEASISNVAVVGFGKGIRLRSTINGGAVYNRFYNVKAQSCTIGWSIESSGSNGNVFTACRANNCDTGVDITDSNNNTWIAPQIEACTLGFRIHATSAALSDYNAISLARFENNTTAWETTALVRYTAITEPKPFGTAYQFVDAGAYTNHTGVIGSQPNYWSSLRSAPDGTWRFQRSAHGGAEHPAMVVQDTNTATGTPVTIQAETERAAGYFYRGKRNGTTYWDVDAYGNTRSPQGGYNELTERTAAPPAPSAGGARMYLQKQTSTGKTGLYVRFATGSPVQIALEP